MRHAGLAYKYIMQTRIFSIYVLLYLVTLCFSANILNLILPGFSSLLPSNSSNSNRTTALQTDADYPVSCFHHKAKELKPVGAEDCDLIINHIVIGYPNPMTVQIWGYQDNVDIDLRLTENRKWSHGHCVVFVRQHDNEGADAFRPVDVATTAQRILDTCVLGLKRPLGGVADIGSRSHYFYVGIAAPLDDLTMNDTIGLALQ